MFEFTIKICRVPANRDPSIFFTYKIFYFKSFFCYTTKIFSLFFIFFLHHSTIINNTNYQDACLTCFSTTVRMET